MGLRPLGRWLPGCRRDGQGEEPVRPRACIMLLYKMMTLVAIRGPALPVTPKLALPFPFLLQHKEHHKGLDRPASRCSRLCMFFLVLFAPCGWLRLE
jgi:hypothetical protein